MKKLLFLALLFLPPSQVSAQTVKAGDNVTISDLTWFGQAL